MVEVWKLKYFFGVPLIVFGIFGWLYPNAITNQNHHLVTICTLISILIMIYGTNRYEPRIASYKWIFIVTVPAILISIVGFVLYKNVDSSHHLLLIRFLPLTCILSSYLMYKSEIMVESNPALYSLCINHNRYPCFQNECRDHMLAVKNKLVSRIWKVN